MMNIGIVEPEPGYLQALKGTCASSTASCSSSTRSSPAPPWPRAGPAERYGVRPHLACFAKALFGGTPGAAFGGDDEIMDVIAHGAAQMGTFNGNPLVSAAGLASLTEIMTPDAYVQLAAARRTRLADGCQTAIDANGIPAHTVDLGAKGCVSFRKERSPQLPRTSSPPSPSCSAPPSRGRSTGACS